MTPAQKKIVGCLLQRPMSTDEIASITGLKNPTIRGQISQLNPKEMHGYKVFRNKSKYVMLKSFVEIHSTNSSSQEANHD